MFSARELMMLTFLPAAFSGEAEVRAAVIWQFIFLFVYTRWQPAHYVTLFSVMSSPLTLHTLPRPPRPCSGHCHIWCSWLSPGILFSLHVCGCRRKTPAGHLTKSLLVTAEWTCLITHRTSRWAGVLFVPRSSFLSMWAPKFQPFYVLLQK